MRAYNNVTATRALADGGVDFYFTTVNVGGPGNLGKDAPVNGTFHLPTFSLTLCWFPASGANSYEVCPGTAASSCGALPGNTWLNVGNALTTSVTNLLPGITYLWQVRALNGGGTPPANGGA
ncbi:MAG: fibronectin type III domain-containing protein [Methylacidiphilales bacterium]|nr:fibronectin type III domain-containing protein [Candidatus Methylacidiphilales bacterium]